MDSDSSINAEDDFLLDKMIKIRNFLTDEYAQIHLKLSGDKISAAKKIDSFDIYQDYCKQLRNNSWQKNQEISFSELTPYPFHVQIAFLQIFEKILKNSIEVPIRAKYLRTIILELERISNHLSFIGNLGDGISFPLLSSKAFSVRALILEHLKEITSKSGEKCYLKIGGVATNIEAKRIKKLLIAITSINESIIKLRRIFYRNSILKGLLQDIGFVSRDSANKLSLVGPFARASGITIDVRKTDPYAAYEMADFNIAVYDSCDLYGEIMVRLDEIIESIYIVRQLLENIPDEEIILNVEISEIPSSNSIMRIETPSGELFSSAISKKGIITDRPVDYHIVSPIKLNIHGILSRISGESYDNLSIILLFIGEGWNSFK